MEPLYSILVFPISPIIALLADILIRSKLPKSIALYLILLCCLIASPLLLTDYSYGDFYSYWLVVAIISTILIFVGFKYLGITRLGKIIISVALVMIFLAPAGVTLFVRGFVGEDKTYDVQRIKGYKLIYKREADAVLSGVLKVELYKTTLFGLLQKEIDVEYVDQNKSPCSVKLSDDSKNRLIQYDPCTKTVH